MKQEGSQTETTGEPPSESWNKTAANETDAVMANDPPLFDQHKSIGDVLDSTAAC